jgi:UDP-N-acetyl-D-mannosaminuronate dehydrogenase
VALQRNSSFGRDAVVVGGCGHAGLPLTVAFAGRGVRV